MEKKIAIGLIKLDVLSNIDAQDAEALQYLKRNDDDFPWKELGDYQNLIAQLAVTSKIEQPDTELKSKIFERLYSFKPRSEQEEVFETSTVNETQINSGIEETTNKFKIDSIPPAPAQGPIVEIEEFDIDTPAEIESTEEQKEEVQNQEKSPVENIYEIEEYDLEVSQPDTSPAIEETSEESLNQDDVIQPVAESHYEIEEIEINLEENPVTESTVELTQEVQDAEPENSQTHEDDETKPELSAIENTSEVEIQTQTFDAAESPIEKDDDIIIYNDSESVDNIAAEISENFVQSVSNQLPVKEEINDKLSSHPEKQDQGSTSAKSKQPGEIISFREPNLSQLHSLFKENQETNGNEKNARQDFRNKNKEHLEVVIKQVEEEKSLQAKTDNEAKPNQESKTNEAAVLHEQEIKQEATERIEAPPEKEKVKSPVKLKKQTSSGSFKKAAVIAASIIVLCASVLFFMQSSNEVKGEPVNLSQNENQVNQVNSEQPTETYTEVVEEKKPEGTVIVENIVPVKQKNKIELQPENKLPSPPKQPTPIVPELNTEIKSNTTSTEKKEPVEVPKKEEKIVTPPKEEKKIDEEPSYFVAVEEMPSPIGGLAGIQQRVVYPNLAKLAGIEGKVIVQAYVNENGTVTKVELIKGIGAGCDEVALDAVRQTKFKPGLQRGKPVKVKVTIPIVFKKN